MKKILLLAFTASVMLGACKKDNGTEELEKSPTCATVRITEDEDTWSYAVSFDEQGRVKDDGDFIYEYLTNKIIVTDNYSLDKSTTTHTLDGQGRIIKSVSSYRTANYEYNNEGYLVKTISTEHGSTITDIHTWESENLVKTVTSYQGSNSDKTSIITYGNDVLKDKLVAGVIFREIYCYQESLQDYYGKKPKNAPSKIKDENDTWTQTDTYTYSRDSKGNINGYKQTRSGTDWTWDYSVDYNCK